MPKRPLIAAIAALAAATLLIPATTASAQDTGELLVLHGLNLGDQTAQSDGGTPFAVCTSGDSGEPALLNGVEFGDFESIGAFEVGETIQLWFLEDPDGDQECSEASFTLVTEEVTIGDGTTVLVVGGNPAGANGATYGLTPFTLDTSCTEPGSGRLTAAHAAMEAGEVTVVSGEEVQGELSIGDMLALDLPVGTDDVNVLASGEPIFDPDLGPVEGENTLAVVVGDFPDEGSNTAVVPLVAEIATGVCDDDAPTPPADPDPESEADPETDQGNGPSGTGAPGAAAGERPLALTG